MQNMAWMKRQWAGKCRHLYTDKVEQVMKLTEIYQNKKTVLSFEIFPPKKEEELKNIDRTLEALCEVQPDFISVTFGAGGSANKIKQ